MRLTQWFSKLMNRKKEIDATPQLLAGALNLMVVKHLDLLLSFVKEDHISVSEIQVDRFLSELFCFYYSLYSFHLGQHFASDADMNFYGATLLKDARRLLADGDFPDSIKVWIRDDSLFLPDFDASFRFYYHNTIPQTDQQSLQRVLKFCQADESNPALYLAAKLQFRISNVLGLTPRDRSFIPLWIRQSTMIIGFTRTVNETNPVLR